MNKSSKPNPHENFIHPYVFMLKEGNQIQNNFLDYSLLMLQTTQSEIIKSPKLDYLKSSSNQFIHLLKK